MRSGSVLFLALLYLMLGLAGVRGDDSRSDFYRSHPLNIIVGNAPGGGFDLYARLLAQHIGDYIPGHPSAAVQNMPGGAGVRLLQYLGFEAPRDGTTLGLFNAALINGAVLDPDQFKINFRPFGWLGSFSGDTKVCFASSRSGIRSIADLSDRRMNVGGTTQGSAAQYGAIMKAILGDHFNLVFGYQSNIDVWLAIDKGEVDGGCTGWASIPAARPTWISEKMINVLVQFARVQQPGIPVAPLAVDVAQSPTVRSAIEFLTAADAFTRPVVLPPGTPPERLLLLQDAFSNMLRDPTFLNHAKSLNIEIDPISGADLSVLVNGILDTPEMTVSTARNLIKQ